MATRAGVRRVVRFLAGPTCPLWLFPLAWALAYSPASVVSWVGAMLLFGYLLGTLVFLAAAVVVMVGPVFLFFREHRRPAGFYIGRSVVFLASFVGGTLLGHAVRAQAVRGVVARSEPLVAAIHQFVDEHRRPPDTLDELVPRYLSAVPTTGIGARPDYHYSCGQPASYDGNPWVLIAHPVCIPMGFDSLMYFPIQNYPESGYGGGLERIGTWAYVHE